MIAFFIFVCFLVAQRLAELLLARRNETYLVGEGGVEIDKRGYTLIVLMHVGFFVSLIAEKLELERPISPLWIPLAALFGLAQILRYWAIATLGRRWNTKIIVLPGARLIHRGPYRYLNHPNYLAVAVEILTIPLIFSCYYTALVFNILNALLLRRRIRIEEGALSASCSQGNE